MTPPKKETNGFHHRFLFRGKRYSIFKRPESPLNWYFRIERNGKSIPTSLRTNAEAAAVAQAKLLIEAADLGKLVEIRGILSGRTNHAQKPFCATENFLARYESTPTGENEKSTRHAAVLAFRRLSGDELPATMEPAALEKMCKDAKARAAAQIEAEPDASKKNSMRTTFDSYLRNATSIFSEEAVYRLRDELTLPTFEEFAKLRSNIKNIYYGPPKKTVKEFHPPSDEILEKTVADWLTLPNEEFLAAGLALCAGLRRKEIHEAADWSWFVVKNKLVWLDGYANPKDRTGLIYVQCLDPFYSLMMERLRADGWATSGKIVTSASFHLNVSAWMKNFGWKTKKHLHALRAWAGSLVYDIYGADASRRFCRHDSIETTDEHYGYMRKKFHAEGAPIFVAGRTVEWAKPIT